MMLFFIIFFSACRIQQGEEPQFIPTERFITPYFTPTPSQTDQPFIENSVSPTPRPFPTATPFTYTVVEGNTMIGIAVRHGVDLADLMAANPEINPRILPIGSELIIPQSDDFQAALITPTPIPMETSDPVCYRTNDGGLWCFLSVENNRNEAVENVIARISLLDTEGNLVAENQATTPLNVIPEFQTMPVVSYFPPPLPTEITFQGDLISVLPLLTDNNRYLDIITEQEDIVISADNLQATVSGNLLLSADQDPATEIWLAVVAYDENGVVVGLRKWEAIYSEEPDLPGNVIRLEEPLQVGKRLPYEITVYSLGQAITHIDTFVEARP
ncbi:MAG: LysM peptidoglycan-binding domain-containing protein [Anaerolineales bacterium]|nr:LysM peptidoglycan-binding domain-containing protein [Anaerolineales bacterium]